MKLAAILMFALILSSCSSRNREAFSDNLDKEHRNVVDTTLVCWSGGKEVVRIHTNKRIWIREGGHYEYISNESIQSVTGDCHLTETFEK